MLHLVKNKMTILNKDDLRNDHAIFSPVSRRKSFLSDLSLSITKCLGFEYIRALRSKQVVFIRRCFFDSIPVLRILAVEYLLEILLQLLAFCTLEVALMISDVDKRVPHVRLHPKLRFEQGLQQCLLRNFFFCRLFDIIAHLTQLNIIESKATTAGITALFLLT